MKFVSCTLETPYGKASSKWKFAAGTLVWQISSPCNTRIKVKLPEVEAEKVTLDGKVITDKEFELANGSYSIKIKLK